MSATVNPGKPGRPAKGHKGRQRKASCPGCGFIVYASASAYTRTGMPTCGCGTPMELANLRDVVAIEPERLEGLSEKAFNAAMRELGFTDMIRAKQPPRWSQQPQCANDGCSRFRKTGERLCAPCAELEALPF
jgi:hypothetical protein